MAPSLYSDFLNPQQAPLDPEEEKKRKLLELLAGGAAPNPYDTQSALDSLLPPLDGLPTEQQGPTLPNVTPPGYSGRINRTLEPIPNENPWYQETGEEIKDYQYVDRPTSDPATDPYEGQDNNERLIKALLQDVGATIPGLNMFLQPSHDPIANEMIRNAPLPGGRRINSPYDPVANRFQRDVPIEGNTVGKAMSGIPEMPNSVRHAAELANLAMNAPGLQLATVGRMKSVPDLMARGRNTVRDVVQDESGMVKLPSGGNIYSREELAAMPPSELQGVARDAGVPHIGRSPEQLINLITTKQQYMEPAAPADVSSIPQTPVTTPDPVVSPAQPKAKETLKQVSERLSREFTAMLEPGEPNPYAQDLRLNPKMKMSDRISKLQGYIDNHGVIDDVQPPMNDEFNAQRAAAKANPTQANPNVTEVPNRPNPTPLEDRRTKYEQILIDMDAERTTALADDIPDLDKSRAAIQAELDKVNAEINAAITTANKPRPEGVKPPVIPPDEFDIPKREAPKAPLEDAAYNPQVVRDILPETFSKDVNKALLEDYLLKLEKNGYDTSVAHNALDALFIRENRPIITEAYKDLLDDIVNSKRIVKGEVGNTDRVPSRTAPTTPDVRVPNALQVTAEEYATARVASAKREADANLGEIKLDKGYSQSRAINDPTEAGNEARRAPTTFETKDIRLGKDATEQELYDFYVQEHRRVVTNAMEDRNLSSEVSQEAINSHPSLRTPTSADGTTIAEQLSPNSRKALEAASGRKDAPAEVPETIPEAPTVNRKTGSMVSIWNDREGVTGQQLVKNRKAILEQAGITPEEVMAIPTGKGSGKWTMTAAARATWKQLPQPIKDKMLAIENKIDEVVPVETPKTPETKPADVTYKPAEVVIKVGDTVRIKGDDGGTVYTVTKTDPSIVYVKHASGGTAPFGIKTVEKVEAGTGNTVADQIAEVVAKVKTEKAASSSDGSGGKKPPTTKTTTPTPAEEPDKIIGKTTVTINGKKVEADLYQRKDGTTYHVRTPEPTKPPTIVTESIPVKPVKKTATTTTPKQKEAKKANDAVDAELKKNGVDVEGNKQADQIKAERTGKVPPYTARRMLESVASDYHDYSFDMALGKKSVGLKRLIQVTVKDKNGNEVAKYVGRDARKINDTIRGGSSSWGGKPPEQPPLSPPQASGDNPNQPLHPLRYYTDKILPWLEVTKDERAALNVEMGGIRGARAIEAQKAFSEALMEGKTLQEAKNISMGKLKGKLTATEESLSPPLSLDEIDELETMIWVGTPDDIATHISQASYYDRLNTSIAFDNMMKGKVLRDWEISRMEDLFGADFGNKLRKKELSGMDKVGEALVNITAAPIESLTGLDVSILLRQLFFQSLEFKKGGPVGAYIRVNPAWRDAAKNVWDIMGNGEDAAKIADNAVRNDPYFPLYKLLGGEHVDYGDMLKGKGNVEEFSSKGLNKVPLFKRTGLAFTVPANTLRFNKFKRIAMEWEAAGKTVANDHKDYKDLVELLNYSTGRGNIGERDRLAKLLNIGFLSPRFNLSRLQLVAKLADPRTSKAARQVIAGDMVASIGTTLSVLAIGKATGVWDVETDARSPDFLKVRVGEHIRIDPWAGYQQIARLVAQMYSGERRLSTGEISKSDWGDALLRFVQSKTSPFVSAGIDLKQGQDFVGNKFADMSDLEKAAWISGKIIPMSIQDLYDVMKNDGVMSGLFVTPAIAVGFGVNSYKLPFERYDGLYEYETANTSSASMLDKYFGGDGKLYQALWEYNQAKGNNDQAEKKNAVNTNFSTGIPDVDMTRIYDTLMGQIRQRAVNDKRELRAYLQEFRKLEAQPKTGAEPSVMLPPDRAKPPTTKDKFGKVTQDWTEAYAKDQFTAKYADKFGVKQEYEGEKGPVAYNQLPPEAKKSIDIYLKALDAKTAEIYGKNNITQWTKLPTVNKDYIIKALGKSPKTPEKSNTVKTKELETSILNSIPRAGKDRKSQEELRKIVERR